MQTLDFFTPIVDDPYTFGQIAACNSLSDIYAMGGRPLTAMNILCFPIKERDPAELAAILRGGADKLAEANVSLVGGHSMDDPEPKFGMSVSGLVHPDRIAKNAGAQPGDIVVLTKPIGTGIITTAAKFDKCGEESLDHAVTGMCSLNAGAAEAMAAVGIGPDRPIHAATDITGFGIIGHLLHLAQASGVALRIDTKAMPLYKGVEELAMAGCTTAGATSNLTYARPQMNIADSISEIVLDIVSDPQTSGGLAICVAPESVLALIELLRANNTMVQAVIGDVIPLHDRHLILS